MTEMSSDAKHILAEYFMCQASGDSFVNWASVLLEEGYDTANLRILAGLGSDPHWQDVDLYFQLTVQDLGLTSPTPEETIRLYAVDVAMQMQKTIIPLRLGVERLYNVCNFLDYPEDLKIWMYLDEDLTLGEYRQYTDEEWSKTVLEECEEMIAIQMRTSANVKCPR